MLSSTTCGDPRVMFVDISPPAGTRVASAQVARGRRHGREAGLGTWVFERRVCESEAATHGVRETVVPRRRVEGAGTTAEGYEYYIARVCCICVRYRIKCARTRSILPHLIRLHSQILGFTLVKEARGRAPPCVPWTWQSASDVCRYLAARRHARRKCAGGTRASARTRRRPGHVGMRAAGV